MGECVFLASTQVSWPTASPAARTRRWRRCAQLPNEGGLRTKKEKVSSMKMGSSRRSVILKEVKMLWGSAFRSPKCMNEYYEYDYADYYEEYDYLEESGRRQRRAASSNEGKGAQKAEKEAKKARKDARQ